MDKARDDGEARGDERGEGRRRVRDVSEKTTEGAAGEARDDG